MAAVRHWHIEAGFGSPQWPRLHYVSQGIKRHHAGSPRQAQLPITPDILRVWAEGLLERGKVTCYFGFLRAKELLDSQGSAMLPSVQVGDVIIELYLPNVDLDLFENGKSRPFYEKSRGQNNGTTLSSE